MLDKSAVEEMLDKFSKKAKLHSLSEKQIKVKAAVTDPEKFFSDLLQHMRASLKHELELEAVKKTAKIHIATYIDKGMSPADEIISILDRYYEGTKRAHECCDD